MGHIMHNMDADARKIRRTSAGAVVLRQCEGKWMALVLRAWSHWDFPKGNVESGETLMQAAVREVMEETGVCDLSFPWGEAFARTCVYSKDKVAYYSLALTTTECVSLDVNPITGEKEHDEFRWVPWEDLPCLLSPRLQCILEWAALLAKLPPLDFSKRPAELQTQVCGLEKLPRDHREKVPQKTQALKSSNEARKDGGKGHPYKKNAQKSYFPKKKNAGRDAHHSSKPNTQNMLNGQKSGSSSHEEIKPLGVKGVGLPSPYAGHFREHFSSMPLAEQCQPTNDLKDLKISSPTDFERKEKELLERHSKNSQSPIDASISLAAASSTPVDSPTDSNGAAAKKKKSKRFKRSRFGRSRLNGA